jgi:predicted O-linked N-acetylglucosamine transferase (SPINDLY family)
MDQLGRILMEGAQALTEKGLEAALPRLAPLFDRETAAEDICNRLADAAYRRREFSIAEVYVRAATERAPDNHLYLNTLGNVLCAQGRTAEAVASLEAALVSAPGQPVILFNLGTAWLRAGRFSEAEASLRAAVAGQPTATEPLVNLSNALNGLGRAREAAALLQDAEARLPGQATLPFNLGNTLKALNELDGAADAYRRALALDPSFAKAWCNLGAVEAERGYGTVAEGCLRRAIRCDPNLTEAFSSLAELAEPGTPAAIHAREEILAARPGLATVRSDMLMSMQYLAEIGVDELAAAHRDFGRAHEDCRRWFAHDGHDFDSERRLKIGVLSGHFRFHAMAFLCLPVLAHHDAGQIELTCYSSHAKADDYTRAIRETAAAWRDVQHLDDDAVAELIHRDGIDLLIDLSGHTPRNRLLAVGRRPAPLQVAWGDYVHSRGLAAIDWLIADRHHIRSEDEPLYRERIARLPHDYVCYSPPDYAPPVAPAPALATGHVTFGSFNETTKIQPATVTLWSRVLHAVPTARLLVNNHLLREGGRAEHLRRMFAAEGIAPERLAFRPGGAHADFLDDYRLIDIMLDTIPYSGGLTTCEALWQGVPVVTLTGDRFCGRHSTAHLTTAGYADWIADTSDRFVEIAVGLARDLPVLAAHRAALRTRMAASPLTDVAAFADDLFGLLRSLWRARCAAEAPQLEAVPS